MPPIRTTGFLTRSLPTEYQLGSAIRRNAARFPGIAVFPQVQRKAGWAAEDVRFAMEALERTERDFVTDADRVYLTGVSWWQRIRD